MENGALARGRGQACLEKLMSLLCVGAYASGPSVGTYASRPSVETSLLVQGATVNLVCLRRKSRHELRHVLMVLNGHLTGSVCVCQCSVAAAYRNTLLVTCCVEVTFRRRKFIYGARLFPCTVQAEHQHHISALRPIFSMLAASNPW